MAQSFISLFFALRGVRFLENAVTPDANQTEIIALIGRRHAAARMLNGIRQTGWLLFVVAGDRPLRRRLAHSETGGYK